MEEEDMRTAVELYIYDLTKGMAAMMSPILIGEYEKLDMNDSIGIFRYIACINFFNTWFF